MVSLTVMEIDGSISFKTANIFRMFHGKVYRVFCVRATEFDGDWGDIAIIGKFYFRGMCHLAVIVRGKGIDGRIDAIVGLAILSGWIFRVGERIHDSR